MTSSDPTPEQKFDQLRTLVESILKDHPALAGDHLEGSLKKLTYELYTHQIELELQNEQLQIMKQELVTSREEFQDFFDFAPIMYLILDNDGNIARANLTAADRFGVKHGALVGKTLSDMLVPTLRDEYYLHYRRLVRSRQPQASTLLFNYHDSKQFYGRVESVLINPHDPDDHRARVAILDVTERTIYENRLKGLRKLDRAISKATSIREVVNIALQHLSTVTNSRYVRILVFDDEQRPTTKFEYEPIRSDSIVESSVTSDDEIKHYFLDRGEYRILTKPADVAREGMRLVVPVYQGDNQLGIVEITLPGSEGFEQWMIEILHEVAIQLGISIHQTRLYERIQQHASALEGLVEDRTAKLRKSEQSEYEQRLFSEVMLDIVRWLNRSLDLDQVLDQVLVGLERVIPYDGANIVLLEGDVGEIIKSRGNYPENFYRTSLIKLDITEYPLYQQMIETKRPILLGDVKKAPGWIKTINTVPVRSYMGIPIFAEDGILGFINVDKFEPGFFNEQYLQRLEAFAQQAAIAIRNASLHQNAQQIAILEERQRLARDLHDAVSQLLFSINILAETLAQDSDLASTDLRQRAEMIRTLASSAQAEMRLLLLELRPMNMEEVAIDYLLQQLTTGFRGKRAADIALSVAELPFDLHGVVKNVIFRITQEALNNIAKHAKANSVDIALYLEQEMLCLAVRDDGDGFDPSAHTDGYGLQIMRERADEIGATLTLETELGSGTRVLFRVPLAEAGV